MRSSLPESHPGLAGLVLRLSALHVPASRCASARGVRRLSYWIDAYRRCYRRSHEKASRPIGRLAAAICQLPV